MANAKATLQQNSNFADRGERPWLPFLVGTNVELKILALTCKDSLFCFHRARNVCSLLLSTAGICSFLVPIHFMWCLKEWLGGQAELRPMQRKMHPLFFKSSHVILGFFTMCTCLSPLPVHFSVFFTLSFSPWPLQIGFSSAVLLAVVLSSLMFSWVIIETTLRIEA